MRRIVLATVICVSAQLAQAQQFEMIDRLPMDQIGGDLGLGGRDFDELDWARAFDESLVSPRTYEDMLAAGNDWSADQGDPTLFDNTSLLNRIKDPDLDPQLRFEIGVAMGLLGPDGQPLALEGCGSCYGTAGGVIPVFPLPEISSPDFGTMMGSVGGLIRANANFSDFQITTDLSENKQGTLRRVAMIKEAVETLVAENRPNGRKPTFGEFDERTVGTSIRTSLTFVAESEALDPQDTSSWVAFQVTLEEPQVRFVGLTGDQTVSLFVDGYTRRKRAFFASADTSAEIDEDFARMFADAVASNRREQEVAERLFEILKRG